MAGGNKEIYNILIAEDDMLMKDMYIVWLSDILKNNPGSVVSILSNGKEISGYLEKKGYDLTILDVALPGISGIELYKKYKDNMGTVLLASTYSDIFSKYLKDKDKCIILNKPFNKNDLKQSMKSIPEVSINADSRTDNNISEYVFI